MYNLYAQDCFCWETPWNMVWIYHNEDAASGDQFVKNYITSELLKDAVKEHGDNVEAVFDCISTCCKQYCIDIGDECYESTKESFENKPFAIGLTEKTLDRLKKELGVTAMENIVHETCPNCGLDVEMNWDVDALGYKAYCPRCGERLMLCDECLHPNGEYCCNCDYSGKTDSCKHNKSVGANLTCVTVAELARYLAKTITKNEVQITGIRECDFCIVAPDDIGSPIAELREKAAGWYGMQKINSNFGGCDLVLLADYYGGGSAAIAQVTLDDVGSGVDEGNIETLILDTLNNEPTNRNTHLLVEYR